AHRSVLHPSADQVLLPPRGYSFFNSAVQFSTTVTDSDDLVAVSIRSRLPSGATSQPRTCKPPSLWPIRATGTWNKVLGALALNIGPSVTSAAISFPSGEE